MPGRRERPAGPTDLPASGWRAAARRTARGFKDDDLTDHAAALTYYAVLSIFPGLLVVVSLVGLAGRSATDELISELGGMAPGAVRDLLISAIRQLQGAGGAGIVAVVSLAGAVWSASGYVGAFMRASNAVYDVPEGRPFWKMVPLRVGITVLTLVVLSASAVAVVVSGPLAREVGDMLGLGSAAVTAWQVAKWPVLLVMISLLFSLLYWAAPNVRRRFRWVTPGSVVAVLVWLAASGLFALYVAGFAGYNKTYGSLAGVIVFLVWLWIGNLAILLGAELNSELERGRAVQAGAPAGGEPYAEFRDTRAFSDADRRDTGAGKGGGPDDAAPGARRASGREDGPDRGPDRPDSNV
ncbi:YihY/virulence factor BrkB family protein [Actinomadura sp. WMMB 499]|uniref:YihY/virulence factor BrkB family protein n=1 Tax=Actinomadura sp. WMMB 499 TaxID=1219491 RepID=UPI0012480EC7|nr:YihY/virulence factor BrkB family protein [Actinomadura sp. WMMB 499]QFG26699.1 YihY/virulence factor BrkB family protein [Actinomadura sp. WMMB 499]